MGGFGFNEILIVLVLVFFLFGAKKIPELMRGMGKGMRAFQDARNNEDKEPEDKRKEKETYPAVPEANT